MTEREILLFLDIIYGDNNINKGNDPNETGKKMLWLVKSIIFTRHLMSIILRTI